MMGSTIELLNAAFSEFPIMVADTCPAIEEINAAETALGIPFSLDYRVFLEKYGAAMVGPYPIFGLRQVEVMGNDEWSVVDMTKRFRNEGVPEIQAWIVFSMDHAGNPIGMDSKGGTWIYDHDFGGACKLYSNFETFLWKRCLGMKETHK